MKTPNETVDLPELRMSWETYNDLQSRLAEDMAKTHQAYSNTNYVVVECFHRNPKIKKEIKDKILDSLYEMFQEKKNEIEKKMAQLKYAAEMSQGPDAPKEQKEFWGLK